MRNKFLALLLTAVCVTGLTACSNGGETDTETPDTVTEELTETTETDEATEEATEGTEEEAPAATNNGYYDADGNIIMIDTEGVLTGEQKRERDKEVFAFLTMEWERSPKWDEEYPIENYGEIEYVIPSESNSFYQIGDAFFYDHMTDEEWQEVWDNSQIGQMWNKYANEDGHILTDTKNFYHGKGLYVRFPETIDDLDNLSAWNDGNSSKSDLLVDKALYRRNADDTTVPYDFDNDPFYEEDITGVVVDYGWYPD